MHWSSLSLVARLRRQSLRSNCIRPARHPRSQQYPTRLFANSHFVSIGIPIVALLISITSLYYTFLRDKNSAYAKVASIDYECDGKNNEFYLISVVFINDGTRPVVVTQPSLSFDSPDSRGAGVPWEPVSVVFPFVLAANEMRVVQFKLDGSSIKSLLEMGTKAYTKILYQTISSTGDVFMTFSPEEIEFTGSKGRIESFGPKHSYWLNQKTNLINNSFLTYNNQ